MASAVATLGSSFHFYGSKQNNFCSRNILLQIPVLYCSSIKKVPVLTSIKRFFPDAFLPTLVAVVIAAWLWPYPGTKDSPLHLSEVGDIGISLIFLFYGLQLGPEKLQAGLANKPLHVVVQLSTFVLFPVLVLCCKPLCTAGFAKEIWLPFFFLAALPSTVSSSVVMVSIAGGNIPAAIFNASLSSLAGVFITPVWMSFFLQQQGATDMGSIILKLVLQVLLPVILGMLFHKRFGHWAASHKKQLKTFDQFVILLIVYTAFCNSFAEGLFNNFNPIYLVVLLAIVLGLLFLVYTLIGIVCRQLKFNREDTITARFCGSKKSLVHGTVMSKVIFAGAAANGIVLLPLMLYHAVQLFCISFIAVRLQRKHNIAE